MGQVGDNYAAMARPSPLLGLLCIPGVGDSEKPSESRRNLCRATTPRALPPLLSHPQTHKILGLRFCLAHSLMPEGGVK